MNQLKAGFGRVDITPYLGVGLEGYFMKRPADGVLDELEANVLVLEAGGNRTILISLDTCLSYKQGFEPIRKAVSARTGVPFEAIMVAATHSHTAPNLGSTRLDSTQEGELEKAYFQDTCRKVADAAQFAMEDLKPARMGWAVGNASNVAFVRRFRMKDGSVRTNPGVGNPDILHTIGDVDERVNVIRFDQENGKSLVLVNFGNHPDTVGGCKVSADWPGFLRRKVEKAIDNTRCIFFNGAEGDVNHVNVSPKGGDLNDMFMDFDDVSRGYGHARHLGNVMAGAVLQVYDKVYYRDVEQIQFLQKVVDAPSNKPKPEEMELARLYSKLHKEGRDEEIPFKGMQLTTVVAASNRKVRLENGPDSFPLLLAGISVGPVALVGIPGEPFTGIGRGLKEAEGWELVLPCSLANEYIGYFPMQEAYDEGGYEAESSSFKAGIAELIIDEGKKLLSKIQN